MSEKTIFKYKNIYKTVMSDLINTQTEKSKIHKAKRFSDYAKQKLIDKHIFNPNKYTLDSRIIHCKSFFNEEIYDIPTFELFFMLYEPQLVAYFDETSKQFNRPPLTTENLRVAIMANNLDTDEVYEEYYFYNEDNKGCNIDNPFCLDFHYGYIELEYCIMEYLKGPFQAIRFVKQELIKKDDKYIDILTYKPKHGIDSSVETYYFDITNGYNFDKDIRRVMNGELKQVDRDPHTQKEFV